MYTAQYPSNPELIQKLILKLILNYSRTKPCQKLIQNFRNTTKYKQSVIASFAMLGLFLLALHVQASFSLCRGGFRFRFRYRYRFRYRFRFRFRYRFRFRFRFRFNLTFPPDCTLVKLSANSKDTNGKKFIEWDDVFNLTLSPKYAGIYWTKSGRLLGNHDLK